MRSKLMTACLLLGVMLASLLTTHVSGSHAQTIAGGSLTIGVTEEPETLNPYITQLVTSSSVLSGIMQGLLEYNSRQRLKPDLATSYKVSKDGLTYTFNLRKGVKWQDGKPFDARDVVATWKIIMNPDFGAFSQLGWDKITNITTPNRYTVVMHTKEKYAPFLSYVGASTISPKHLIDKGVSDFKEKFGRHPVGTGPYKFVRWQSGASITLAKNTNYWGSKPHLDKITYKIVPNDNTLMVQLRTGEVQMAPYVSAIRYPALKAMPKLKTVLRNSLAWYHLDLKNIGFLMDKRVRVALDYATPTKQIIDRLLHGLAVPSVGDEAPGTPWYNPKVKPRPYDLKKAAQLLKAAGFTKGSGGILQKGGTPFTMEYWIPSGEQQSQEIQQVVSASWRKLGIKVDNHQEDIKTIWGPNGYQFTQAMTAAGYSWFNSDDPDDMFYWHSSQIPSTPTGTGGNLPAYFHKYSFQKQIDRLTAAGVKTLSFKKRRALYWEVQKLLHDQEPVIFMYWPKLIFAAPKNLTGFNPSAYNSLLWNAEQWAYKK